MGELTLRELPCVLPETVALVGEVEPRAERPPRLFPPADGGTGKDGEGFLMFNYFFNTLFSSTNRPAMRFTKKNTTP